MITVLDDVLPAESQQLLEDLCLGVHFPWHYHRTSAFEDEPTAPQIPSAVDTPFFSHLLWGEHGANSVFLPQFKVIGDVVPGIDSLRLERFKINLTMPSPVCNINTHSHLHTDLDIEHISVIYYINDSDGDTVIFNDDLTVKQRIRPQRGRLVMFDGSYLHAGNNPIYSKARVVANINLVSRKL